MKLLLDNNLSPQLVDLLAARGYEVEHVHDNDLRAASDDEVLDFAQQHQFVLISADTHFGQLLHHTGAPAPSVVLIRNVNNRRPAAQARLPLDNLPDVEDDLAAGALVVFKDTRIRVRELPFGR